MSGFPDYQSTFLPPGFGTNTDAITISACPQYPVVTNHSLKRHREEENNQSDNVGVGVGNLIPQRMVVHSSTARVNKGVNNIFYKTRVCDKFKAGLCHNAETCNYAHGVEDLRQPPPNWQELVNGRDDGNWDDEQRIALKMKLCKRFSNGEVCPYGDKCNFLHDDPKRYRNDSTRIRDSSVINLGGSVNTSLAHGNGSDQTEINLVNAGPDAYRLNMRNEHWKTKLCLKFESSGFCSFGDKCGFAHGIAELKGYAGRAEGEIRSVGLMATPMKPIVGVPNSLVSSTMYNAVSNEENLIKKDFSKLKGLKKINRIYGDWIDDFPVDTPLPLP